MIEQFVAWLNLVLTVASTAPTGSGMTGGALAAVALVTACVALASLLLPAPARDARPGSPHPRRAIDVSSPLAQSDPDAPGHPRPRAPQAVAAA